MTRQVYWQSPVGSCDDFEDVIVDEIIDGKTRFGPWALMTPRSFAIYGLGRYGLGVAQRYRKQDDGRWLKVEG